MGIPLSIPLVITATSGSYSTYWTMELTNPSPPRLLTHHWLISQMVGDFTDFYRKLKPIGTLMRPSKVAAAMIALNRADTPSSMSSHNSTISLEDQQTPVLWAYEKGHDRIVMLLKHYANKRMEGDLCSEYRYREI